MKVEGNGGSRLVKNRLRRIGVRMETGIASRGEIDGGRE